MKKALLSFLLAILLGTAFSQEGDPVKITVFQPGGVKQDDVPKPPPIMNLVKWNYSVVSRGVFLMNYEFILNEKFTAEAGAGISYRDFIYEVAKREIFLEYRNPNVNFALEGSFRFYPKGNKGFDGIYLSPTLSYRKYSFDPQMELYGNGYAGYNSAFNPGYSFMDLQVKFGYQYESWWITDLIVDFYLGFGYRNVTAKYYELSSGSNYSTNITPVTKTDSYPQALLGFKLGIGF